FPREIFIPDTPCLCSVRLGLSLASTLFPYTTLFRSGNYLQKHVWRRAICNNLPHHRSANDSFVNVENHLPAQSIKMIARLYIIQTFNVDCNDLYIKNNILTYVL